MKTISIILACVAAVCFSTARAAAWTPYFTPAEPDAVRNYVEEIDKEQCTCRGIKLYGKVKVVESFPDFKVKIVESFPDVKVKVVTSFPSSCGKWQFVEHFPDFTIKYVENFPDIKIKFVENFPGM